MLVSILGVACGSNEGTPDVIVETPLDNGDFVLVENQTKDLCGLRFSDQIKEWYPELLNVELIPVAYKDIEVLYGDHSYVEIKATGADGLISFIRAGLDYRTCTSEYVVAATCDKIELCRLSEYSNGENFYMLTDSNGVRLIRVNPRYYSAGEFGTIKSYGPYEQIVYSYDDNPYSYLFKQGGKYGVAEMEYGFQKDSVVVDAIFDEIIMYNMVGSFHNYFHPDLGFYGSDYMGGDFFLIKQTDGSYMMTTGDKDMKSLCKLSADEVALIRSEAGVADDALLVATSFFPENRTLELYNAGKKISTRFWF